MFLGLCLLNVRLFLFAIVVFLLPVACALSVFDTEVNTSSGVSLYFNQPITLDNLSWDASAVNLTQWTASYSLVRSDGLVVVERDNLAHDTTLSTPGRYYFNLASTPTSQSNDQVIPNFTFIILIMLALMFGGWGYYYWQTEPDYLKRLVVIFIVCLLFVIFATVILTM